MDNMQAVFILILAVCAGSTFFGGLIGFIIINTEWYQKRNNIKYDMR